MISTYLLGEIYDISGIGEVLEFTRQEGEDVGARARFLSPGKAEGCLLLTFGQGEGLV